MTCPSDRPAKSILKPNMDHRPSFGSYNIYAKRASFKEDVIAQQFVPDRVEEPAIAPPIVEERLPILQDEEELELSTEEAQKRKEFKDKRRHLALEGADGLDLKAVLGRRLSGADAAEDEEDDDYPGREELTSIPILLEDQEEELPSDSYIGDTIVNVTAPDEEKS